MKRSGGPKPPAAAIVAMLLGLGGWGNALAQAPEASRSRRNVELSLVGAVDEDLVETVRELLGRLGLRLVAPSAQGMQDELARVSVDLGSAGEARVLVVDARSGDVVLRRTIPRTGTGAIFREAISHAVDEAIQSELLAEDAQARAPGGSRVGQAEAPVNGSSSPAPPGGQPETPQSPPASAAPPAPPPPPPPPEQPPPRPSDIAATPPDESGAPAPRKRAFGLDVATLAGAGPFASGSYAVARVEGGVALASRRGLRPSVGLTVAYLVPFGPSSQDVDYRANVLSLRALGGIEVIHGTRFSLGFTGGAGVDVLTVAPGGDQANLVVGPTTTRADPILTVGMTGSFAAAQGVALTLGAVCDFDLFARSYVEDIQGGPAMDVFVPWSVRPMLLAGFTFTALGEGVFAKGAR